MSKKVFTSNSDNAVSVLFEEKTSKRSYLDTDSMLLPWNPDDLVQKHQDFSVYEEMCKDDQVSVCLQLKKDLILCSGYDFIAQEEGQEDIIEDLKLAIREDPELPFEEMLEEMLTSCEFGFSISEKIFKLRDDGKLSLRCIKTRHPGPWLLHTDDGGNIIRYEQRGVSSNIDVPAECLIHFVNKRKFQNPYGVSDLRPAYQPWFVKKHISRWYAIFIEKAGSPVPVGKYDTAIATEQAKQDLHNALKRFQTKTSMVIPKEFEVDFLEAKSNGEAFINGLNLFNMYIGRSLLIPDLLGFSGSETGGGSYALGEKQLEIFYKHIQRRREVLERTINNEIVWPIVLYNFGNISCYPKFKLRPITEQHIIESTKLWLDAVKSNVYKPSAAEITHFKEIINYPVEGDEEEQDPSQETEQDPGANPGSDGEDGSPEDSQTGVAVYPTTDGDESTFAKKERKYGPTNGPYAAKTDFELIEKNMDTSLNSLLAVSKGMVRDILEEFGQQIEKKKIVQKGADGVDKLDSLDVKKTAALRTKLLKDLKDGYKKAGEIASTEVFKGNFAKPIIDEKFLQILEAETFQFIGDWSMSITKRAKVLLIAAIKDGKPVSEVVRQLMSEMQDKSQTDIERWTRTKFTEVLNKGRLNFFNSTKVIAGYQYSAILDDRTTEICRGLHGKKFVAGTEPIPPMHFNCRSVLVPITIYEQFTPDEKVGSTPIDQFIDEKIGQGFPKQ